MSEQTERPLVKVKAAARRTGIDERTLRRAAADGEIPSKRIRRTVLLFPDWVDEFMTPQEGDIA